MKRLCKGYDRKIDRAPQPVVGSITMGRIQSQTVDRCRSPWNTGEGFSGRARRPCFAALVAALGVTMLLLGAAPAMAAGDVEVASPVTNAPPARTTCIFAEDIVTYNGHRPHSVQFDHLLFTETKWYIDGHYGLGVPLVDRAREVYGHGPNEGLCVRPKSTPTLKEMTPPPPDPFTVTVTVYVSGIAWPEYYSYQDNSFTGSGTVSFVTDY